MIYLIKLKVIFILKILIKISIKNEAVKPCQFDQNVIHETLCGPNH